jgi:hypothetical protein
MIGPATNTQIEVGLNMKDVKPRTAEGRAARAHVSIQGEGRRTREVDAELVAWIRQAYDAAR